MHVVACHGPVDAVTRLTVDDRVAWSGIATGGPITVNAPNLFGGEGREGGVSGTIDIEMGRATQTKNSYLLSKIGSAIPAFRGVLGLVFRQCYMGNNPYLKPWRLRAQRVFVRQDGISQWYSPKAPIGSLSGQHAIYIALDKSISMNTVVSGSTTRLDNAKTSVNGLLDYLANFLAKADIDIQIVAWGGTRTSVLRRDVDSADITALKAFVNGITTVASTDFRQGVADASSFFSGSEVGARRTVLFITDGEPDLGGSPTAEVIASEAAATLFAIPSVNSYAFNIDLESTTYTAQMDNTAGDGVPVVSGSDSSALLGSLSTVLTGTIDMNPAHIIRECLTDPDWGMGYSDADVDDDAFEAAADQLYLESLGISLLWDKQITLEAFISEIVRHIDGALFVSRSTGKFVLKLTRADYDVETLIELDESNIDKIEAPSRAAFGELSNSVTVNFWNSETGRTDSVTVQDPAGVQQQGAVINTPMTYQGFTNVPVAARVAARDLRALSNPFLTCTVFAGEEARELEIGDTFKLSWAKWRLNQTVMRVTGLAFGDGRSSQVRITCVEDVFATPLNAVIVPPDDGWVDPSQPPEAAAEEIAFEVPYYELVQALGQTDVDTQLGTNPEMGFVGASATRGDGSAISARLWTDAGAGYTEADAMDLSPGGYLVADLGRLDTSMTIEDGTDLDLVTLGSHAQIGEELIRIDALDTVTGVATIARGLLDTVPLEHAAGAPVLFWDNYNGVDPTEYVSGETINAKITPVSGQGQFSLTSAVPIEVTLNQRAFRPYRPGKVAINGELDVGPGSDVDYPATVTWEHRNRLMETSGTFFAWVDNGVTPEEGITYRVTLFALDELGDPTQIHQEDVGLVDTWELDPELYTIPPGSLRLRFRIETMRDTLASWTYVELDLPLLLTPEDFAGTSGYMFAPEDLELETVGGGI